MKKRKISSDDKMATKVFETLAISEANQRTKKGRVAIPSKDNVDEARDWVIHNKK